MRILFLALLCYLFSPAIYAFSDTTDVQLDEMSDEEMMEMYQFYLDSISNTLNYQTGNIQLKDGLATLNVPKGYKYLGPEESNMVLTELWGNPPSAPEDQSLGMLFPEDSGPNDFESYAINITYSEEGYIDDTDAKDLDYDELLQGMQEGANMANDERIELGYEPVVLLGWASKPFYDAENKKLHWAKELKFGEAEENTLNYNIRVLGRKGYLELNAISEMKVLSEVKNDIPTILSAIEFNSGYRYVDFDPNIDKVAAYGIGGLIAGKVLAKAGILAKIGLILAKFWKIVAIAVVGFFAGIRKFFTGKSKEEEELVS